MWIMSQGNETIAWLSCLCQIVFRLEHRVCRVLADA